jgi:hypothetical protein
MFRRFCRNHESSSAKWIRLSATSKIPGTQKKNQKVVIRSAPQEGRFEYLRTFVMALTNPRRDPVFYSNRGFADPLAEQVSAGRADPEYARLKILCFFTTMATWGTWLYAIYFPEKMKQYKDEPWSPFDN